MSPGDLSTLSLLDPDQGVCPDGHPCHLSDQPGWRRCAGGEYEGLGLVCWEITAVDIDRAREAGADPALLDWARSFLSDRP